MHVTHHPKIFPTLEDSILDFLKLRPRYKVFRIHPKTDEQVADLKKFASEDIDFDIWNEAKPTARSTDIMVPPHRIDHLTNFLKANEISYSTMIQNVETYVLYSTYLFKT